MRLRGRPLFALFQLVFLAVFCLCGFERAAGEEVGGEDVRTVAVLNFVNRNPGLRVGLVGNLLGRGYDGGFSIEPHLAAVVHEGKPASAAGDAYGRYVEYGRRLMKLVEELG